MAEVVLKWIRNFVRPYMKKHDIREDEFSTLLTPFEFKVILFAEKAIGHHFAKRLFYDWIENGSIFRGLVRDDSSSNWGDRVYFESTWDGSFGDCGMVSECASIVRANFEVLYD